MRHLVRGGHGGGDPGRYPGPRMPASWWSSCCRTWANGISPRRFSPNERLAELSRMTADDSAGQPLEIPRDLHDAMVAHCVRESPLECCGILGGVSPRVSSFHPLRNELASETRYNADPQRPDRGACRLAAARGRDPGDLPLASALAGGAQQDRPRGEPLRAVSADHRFAQRGDARGPRVAARC